MTVRMRDLWGDYTDLETVQARTRQQPLIVAVPGFGHVAADLVSTNEPIVRLAEPTLLAGLVQQGKLIRRDVKRVDDGWEVELLPNSSGEDRLVVCIPAEDVPS